MKFKRLMALAMAGVMTLGMSSIAMAAEHTYTDDDGNTVTTWELDDEGKDGIVSKKVKSNAGVTTAAATDFAFTITEISGPSTITFTDTTITVPAGSVNDTAVTGIKVTEDMFKDAAPGEYVFTIAEVTPETLPDGWTTYNEGSKKYTLRVYKSNDSSKKLEYTLKNGNDEKVNKAEFVNIYDPDIPDDQTTNAAITITKAVSGSEAYSLKTEYTFSALFDYTDLLTKGGKYQVGTGSADDQGTWTNIPENGVIGQIILKNGESVFFKEIPQGVKYSVKEEETKTTLGTYFTGCDTSDGQATTDGTSEAEITYTDAPQTAAKSVTFTNKFETITPTGLAISVAPFIAMFAAVGAAIALYVAAKRRVR